MKIWTRIKSSFTLMKEKQKNKYKEKILIQTDDDNFVVTSLPSKEDNSAIDIHKIVKSMNDQEKMLEVVKNNLDEIITQDNVKKTLGHLTDDSILDILEENSEELIHQKKITSAITAIEDDEKKLKAIENTESITGSEGAEVLNSVKEVSQGKKARNIELKKIKTASELILKMMTKYGYVSQLNVNELTYGLRAQSSKLAIAKICLAKIRGYDENKKKNINSNSKTKMVYDLLRITDIEINEKCYFLEKFVEDKLLTETEYLIIKRDLNKEKERKETVEKEKNYKMHSRD